MLSAYLTAIPHVTKHRFSLLTHEFIHSLREPLLTHSIWPLMQIGLMANIKKTLQLKELFFFFLHLELTLLAVQA